VKTYLRATAFVDTPVGFDGQVNRLAGGLCFFSAYEVITVEGGRRTGSKLVPVSQIGDYADAALVARITTPRPAMTLGERTVRLDQPQVMGILNMTPDSFSDGGKHGDDAEAAAGTGVAMASAGAAIIDVGGESTRPGAQAVWEGDEIKRTQPVIERLARAGVAVSIDTRKASVMEAALGAGAALVNDVSALCFDKQALALMGRSTCPVVLMHSPDAAKSLHDGAAMTDPLIETYDWLEARIEAVIAAGVARERLIVDPGIGFGKSVSANLAILNGLALFHGLGVPLLLGASRKRFIGALAGEVAVGDRLAGSLAVALKAVEQGAQIVRVHDVVETVQALKIWRGLRDQGLSG
jgi:dihydropteroate synthase